MFLIEETIAEFKDIPVSQMDDLAQSMTAMKTNFRKEYTK
jgi:hypothetical protein